MILPSNPPIHAELHPACAQEIVAAIRWYRDIDLPLGFRLRSALRYAARQIILLPDAWPAYLYGTHRFVMRDFPFSLVSGLSITPRRHPTDRVRSCQTQTRLLA